MVLRHTRYAHAIVDERLLTKAFELVTPPSRVQLLVPLAGSVSIEAGDGAVHVGPGEILMLRPTMSRGARFERTDFVDLEWTTDEAAALERPRVVGRADAQSIAALASMISAGTAPFSSALTEALAILHAGGAPTDGFRLDESWKGPTVRDERIARAIEAQLANLSSTAGALDLGELATLSPRQVQRVLESFSATYGLNAGNWRDMRNRWRLQIAVVLASVPDLAVTDIAKDVGYASATALARAFAGVGFPTPLELRAAIMRGW